RGQSPVTKIDLRIMAGMVAEPGKLPMMDADQHRVYASELLQTTSQSVLQSPKILEFLDENPANPIYNTYHNETDWYNEVYQRGITQGYNISVNGGDQRALYHFSLGYTSNKGVVKTTSMERISSRFNADINVLDNFSIGMNVGFSNISRSLLDDGVNFYTSPTYMAYSKSPFLSPYSFTSLGYKSKDYDDADLFGIGNPSSFIQGSQNNYKEYRFNVGFMPVYTINDNWSVSTLFDYSLNKYLEDYFSPMHGSYPRELEGYGLSENTIKNQLIRNTGIFDDTRLNYRLSKKSIELKALLGWRYMTNYLEADYIEAHNSGTDNNTTVGNYDFLQTHGLNNRTKTVSTYANIDFAYLNRYFVNAVLSVDGSSRFGKETKGGIQLFGHSFALFPAVNAAWLISSESFMKDIRFIDYLKLRAGYDVTGNDGIQDYATKAYFVTRRYMAQANGVILSNLANEALQWETTQRLHVGLDMALLNERLLLNVDLFDANTDNLLTLRSLNQTAGVDYYWSNEGMLSNRGFEVSAEAKLVNTKNFQWSLGASIGHYRNLIEDLPENAYTTSAYGAEIRTEVGQPAGVFWGYKTQGVYSSETEALANPMAIVNDNGSLTYFQAGDVIFEDFKQDGILDENDKQIIGDPNPDFYGNISTKFSYKKWTLNTLFTYSYGNEVYNYLRSQLESGKDFSNQTKAMLLRWTADGQDATQPRSVYGDPMGNARFSDRWIEDGSFLRLKSVSLSYAIPINNEFIKGLEFSVSANNLFLFTNYLGLDPESSVSDKVLLQGIDNGLIPQTQSYYLGLKVNL
ncbi:MAG: SusC/RagA family TonB-linked outer membrane protein, partial [Bacteroidales bacterium]|nr:SusC/RagA family TonB-linked outer membrane protein [Bacteroidales bacterium]